MASNKAVIYSRVSTDSQSVEMQLRDLRHYADQRGLTVLREYVDQGISGTKDSRPGLNALMDGARKRQFDAVLVWRFDRWARSTRHLIETLLEFKRLGIEFLSYQENLDTTSPLGQAMFTIVAALGELERNIIIERVKAGLRNAEARGRRLGRPRRKPNVMILSLRQQGLSLRAISAQLKIPKSTVADMVSEKWVSKT